MTNISNNQINLADHFKATSLITRQAARDLFALISTLPGKIVTLDFDKIQYASRSFFDELQACEKELQQINKKLKFKKLTTSLKKLKEFAQSPSKKAEDQTFQQIADAEVISF